MRDHDPGGRVAGTGTVETDDATWAPVWKMSRPPLVTARDPWVKLPRKAGSASLPSRRPSGNSVRQDGPGDIGATGTINWRFVARDHRGLQMGRARLSYLRLISPGWTGRFGKIKCRKGLFQPLEVPVTLMLSGPAVLSEVPELLQYPERRRRLPRRDVLRRKLRDVLETPVTATGCSTRHKILQGCCHPRT
jgi:hypothetical protein